MVVLMIWGILIRDVRSEALYMVIYLLCTYLGGACEIAKGTTVLSRPFETGAAGPLLLLLVFPASVDRAPGCRLRARSLTRTASRAQSCQPSWAVGRKGGGHVGRSRTKEHSSLEITAPGVHSAVDGLGLAAGELQSDRSRTRLTQRGPRLVQELGGGIIAFGSIPGRAREGPVVVGGDGARSEIRRRRGQVALAGRGKREEGITGAGEESGQPGMGSVESRASRSGEERRGEERRASRLFITATGGSPGEVFCTVPGLRARSAELGVKLVV
jgi:hypothetical protein